MNSAWQEFLTAAGAKIEQGIVHDFGDPAAELGTDGDIIADLSHFSLICASGDDARDFLHNQFTNDVNHQGDDESRLNNYCTPKGRILASLRIFIRGGEVCLRVHSSVAEAFSRRLGMFILRSKVVLHNRSDELARFGLAGSGVAESLTTLLGCVPEQENGVSQIDDITLLRLPGNEPRFELHGPAERLSTLWSSLSATATPVGERVWARTEIHAGIPSVTAETVEAFVPQMLNMHLIGGLNFKKGCYPGQEIVARMQYLGQLKRRMYLAHTEVGQPPRAGDALFSPESSSGQGAGKVVDAAPAPSGGYDLLCVAEISTADTGTLHLQSNDGPQLELKALPYPIE